LPESAKRSATIAAWATPALVIAAGIAVSLLGFFAAQHAERLRHEADFEEQAARRLVHLQDAINVHVTLLRSIAGLYAASDFVTREEFKTFVSNQPRAQFGNAYLEWVPRVPAQRREEVDAEARAEGFADFRIWPAGPESEPQTRDRDYFPIFYVEPSAANAGDLGYDLASDPARLRALDRARDSGKPAVTGRLTIAPGPASDPAVVIAFPIYRMKTPPATVAGRRLGLMGFAVGHFQIEKLVNAGARSGGPFLQDIYIYDENAVAPEPRLFYFSPSRRNTGPVAPLPEDKVLSGYHWAGVVEVPARKWTVVFRPAPGYFGMWGGGIAWMTLALGLVLTFLVAGYERRRTIHSRRIERLAADLSVSHAQLKSEIAERKEAEARLRQSQKVEAVGQLTGGVAHDFNNLLTVIIGNLEIAREKLRGDDALAESIQSALTAAVRGASLTQRLLAFARRQVLEPEVLDLNEVVAVIEELLRRVLGESIQIRIAFGKRLWLALADRNQIESALLNLAINARDAMPEGGLLTIETHNASLDSDYARRNDEVEPGDYVVLAVTDTGRGMQSDVLRQAIEPFFTTKEPGKGTGLGLSSVYGFAKQSGGHLKLYSEAGRGTTARLYLPRAKASQAAGLGTNTGAAARGGRESILVVEDEPHVREVAVRHLSEEGYRVLEADQAPAALAVIDSHRGEIDLLLTDVVLAGGMNGRGLATEAVKRVPGLKVLYMSGYGQDTVGQEDRQGPDVVLLQKPFLKSELLKAVRGAFEDG